MSDQNILLSIKANIEGLKQNMSTAASSIKTFAEGVKTAMGPLGAVFEHLGAALLAAFAFKKIEGFLEAIVELGSKFKDLSLKTEIATDSIQKLDNLARVTGISLDTLTNAVVMFGRASVTNGEKVAKVLQAMGLELEEIRKLAPDQQLLVIGKAFQKIEDPALRVTASMLLFKRSGKELLQVFAEGGEEMKKAMEDSYVASRRNIGAVDDLDDAFNELWGNVKKIFVDLVGFTVRTVESIYYIFRTGLLEIGSEFLKLEIIIAKALHMPTEALERELAAVDGKLKETIESYKKLNDPQNQVRSGSADAALRDLLDKSKKTQQEIASQRLEQDRIGKENRIKMAQSENQLMLDLDQITNKQYLENKIELQNKLDAIDLQAAIAKRNLIKDDAAAQAKADTEILKLKQKQNDALMQLNHQLVLESEKDYTKLGEDINKSLVDEMGNVIDHTKTVKEAFSSLTKSIISDMAKIASKNLAMAIFGGFTGASGLGGGFGGGIASFFSKLLPSFDVGSSNVPADMVANIHKGEMIIPADQASIIRDGNFSGGSGPAAVTTSISVVVNGGNVSSDTQSNDSMGNALGQYITSAVNGIIIQQLRDGGILSGSH